MAAIPPVISHRWPLIMSFFVSSSRQVPGKVSRLSHGIILPREIPPFTLALSRTLLPLARGCSSAAHTLLPCLRLLRKITSSHDYRSFDLVLRRLVTATRSGSPPHPANRRAASSTNSSSSSALIRTDFTLISQPHKPGAPSSRGLIALIGVCASLLEGRSSVSIRAEHQPHSCKLVRNL